MKDNIKNLVDYLTKNNGKTIGESPEDLCQKYNVTMPEFNSIRRQLKMKGIVFYFKRKGRRPLVELE